MMGVYCCGRWGWVGVILLCVGRFAQAASVPSGCPVTLLPGQVSSIAQSCSNVTSGNQYNCCASAMLELRISLTEVSPMSTTFSVSEKQGDACLKDLDSALLTLDVQKNFQACKYTAGDIFHTSTHGCHGITKVERIVEILREQRVDFQLIQESCTEASTLCERCRRAVLDATYVVASTGGAGMKANVLQYCSDLVFLALAASNFIQPKASEIGSCLYIAPDCAALFRHFKYLEIQRATDNFSTIIGRGGFGTVYKARFKDGLVAAVKRMNKGTSQGEQEFCKEMELLGRLHHRHLVTLRGYCADRCRERLLVYEYCENGSLKEHLHGAHPEPGQVKLALTWRKRLQIALDVATGLEYLHSYCEPPLCHRDIKSSNILLSENFTAKIADFGLAHAGRYGDANFEPVTTEVHGTPGYMDPEYAETQELTEKSDVYSFGVLLLELVTGQRAISDNINLVDWAQKYMDNVELKTAFLVDSELERHEYTLDELKSVMSIIKQCTQINGKLRPNMRQIVRLLHDTLVHTTLDSSSRSSHSSGHFIPQGNGVDINTNCSV
ncbi:hypothetical protein KC19_1G179700 [Ceratodon purpureus]|uniref:Protein kinase domain-containing protein n=1 Tax=Ceratodon purpureus TaxID=3225 RepID=A0A8T0J8G1_CERPU|nr:hypothetical protein KC19_1G179700 [Ceratodon purpureus]KAG0591503.1 hypothetical protein KC19_1G179700 [Ceratodon purpureus]KAG0591508.1 hypothetical protein KC19_1G179700 [Ceratodon purpureus]